MTIEKLIKIIIQKECDFKGITIASIAELSNNELKLFIDNENREIIIDDSKYHIYRDCEFGKFIVEKDDTKREQVVRMINDIIDCVIGTYWYHWDLRISMNPKEWKFGKKGTIYNRYGHIIEYVSYEDFKTLYSSFKYDLENASEKALDFIIEYLRNEKLPYDFHNLDNKKYTIEEIENKVKQE